MRNSALVGTPKIAAREFNQLVCDRDSSTNRKYALSLRQSLTMCSFERGARGAFTLQIGDLIHHHGIGSLESSKVTVSET
jgi:hypothetical protein